MANQPCPNIAEVTVESIVDNQLVENTFYFEHPGGWPAGSMDTLSDAFEEGWRLEMLSHYPAAVTLSRVVAVDLTSLETERSVSTAPPGAVGTASSDASPNSVAWALQKQTGSRGRGKQGRLFVGPLPEADVSSNSVSETFATGYITALNTVLDLVHTAWPTSIHVVLSRYLNGAKRAAGIGLPILSMGYTNLNIDVQKDRLPDHKRRRKHVVTP